MKANFNYKIFPDMELIVDCVSGDVFYDSYMAYKSRQVNDPQFNPNFNVLLDLRGSNFKFTRSEIDKGVKLLLKNSQFIGKRKIAQLTNTPNQVVVSTLANIKKAESLKPVIFSTLEGAVSFLGYEEETKTQINDILTGIKSAADHN